MTFFCECKEQTVVSSLNSLILWRRATRSCNKCQQIGSFWGNRFTQHNFQVDPVYLIKKNREERQHEEMIHVSVFIHTSEWEVPRHTAWGSLNVYGGVEARYPLGIKKKLWSPLAKSTSTWSSKPNRWVRTLETNKSLEKIRGKRNEKC